MALTKVQKIIDFVERNQRSRGCNWTDIQTYIVEDLCGLGTYNPKQHRGIGCQGLWKCVKSPARNRKLYIEKRADGLYYTATNKHTKNFELFKERASMITAKLDTLLCKLFDYSNKFIMIEFTTRENIRITKSSKEAIKWVQRCINRPNSCTKQNLLLANDLYSFCNNRLKQDTL